MREIKFRAWYENGKNYVPEGSYIAPIWANRPLEDGYIIEQFTGLRDKNGKEIYEGDILGYRTGTGHLCSGIMGWVENEARWSQFIPLKDFEILGNTHENPELLSRDV